MKVSLREFLDKDLPLLAAWRRNIGGENYMSNFRPKGEVPGHAPAQGVWWYVIQEAGADAGTIWLQRDGASNTATLGIFLGEKTLFGRGIGAEAVSAAIERVRENGITKVRLNVRENNLRAIACYSKCGFAAVSSGVKELPDGKKIGYFTMERELS